MGSATALGRPECGKLFILSTPPRCPHSCPTLPPLPLPHHCVSHPLRLLFGRRIARQPLHPEPVFILGHPRTGTTHLHNLLALDPAFAFCSTFHAGRRSAVHWGCATAHPPLGHFAFPHIYPTSTPPHTSAHRLPLLLHLHGSPEAAAVAAAGGAAPDGQYGAELGAASGERRAGCMHLNVNHEGRVGGQRPPTRWTIWSCAGSGRQ